MGNINISALTDKRFDNNKTTINHIFEIKDKSKHTDDFRPSKKQITGYIPKTIIYQTILKYSITFGTKEYFIIDDLVKLFLNADSTLVDFFKDFDIRTNKRNRRIIIKNDIKPFLENLLFLELLESKDIDKLDTNREKKIFYRFTEYGLLMALIIKSDEDRTDPSIYDKIIKQFAAYRKTKNDSASLFSSIFFSKINDLHFARSFVDDLKMIMKDPDFDDQIKLLEKTNNGIIKYTMSFSRLSNYFVESLRELEKIDRRKYEIFIHRLKRIVERFHEIKCSNNIIFEEERMECRNQFSFVVIEGRCDFCNCFIYEKVPLTTYLQIVFRGSQGKCPACFQGNLEYG